ncbi:transposable element Tcb1 transposase [Trichonephila clavipes]|nr:transposable element Tcb1 transposase [Trichonephila clavipes]
MPLRKEGLNAICCEGLKVVETTHQYFEQGTSVMDLLFLRRLLDEAAKRRVQHGSRVGRNQTTVMRICHRWMQEGTTDRRGRSHPPQCTTSREDRRIVRMAVADRLVTSRTVAQHIESVTHHSVSARTIRCHLQQSGLSARRPLLGLPLTQNHRRLHRQ